MRHTALVGSAVLVLVVGVAMVVLVGSIVSGFAIDGIANPVRMTAT